ncbi:MAG: carboxymuconolactone decarboxylase family protein [Thermoanaerobaculia bacterium]
MTDFVVHSQDSAPDAARATLSQAGAAFGFVPNLIAVMAESPALAEAYFAISKLFGETSLSPVERQIVLLTVSHDNACGYCMAAHTTIAQMSRVPQPVIDALRAGEELPDLKLEALRQFTLAVVHQRGRVDDSDIDRFLAAGYGEANILDVILGIGMKTLSNYTNHIADTPLDPAFAAQDWSPAS